MESKKIKKFVKERINARRKKRPVRRYTDDQMFEALKRVGGGQRISENEYTKRRTEEDPTAANFYHRFGSFKVIADMVFGPSSSVERIQDIDEEYVVRLLNEFGVKTKEDYKKKADENPEIFPSEYRIMKMFKNYGNLFAAAYAWSINQQLLKCLEVRLTLRKSPTIEDYIDAGINMKLLLRKYVTVRNLNRFVRLLEESYEVTRRNSGKTTEHDGDVFEKQAKEVFKPFSGELQF